MDDPRAFLHGFAGKPVIIDEAQRWPDLPSWLQAAVDEDPAPGRYFLTGSNQPLLRSRVAQSLAGRAAYLFQAPFAAAELSGAAGLPAGTDAWLAKGFYPPLYDRPFEPADWFAQYVGTYLERDLSQLLQVKDLRSFHRFLRLCAGRTGQTLNLSDLARDADVSHTTVKHWLSILEASFLIFSLPPWRANLRKRLVKSPKLYFWDVGLAGFLAGINAADQWSVHPLRGAFFETMVVADLVKRSLYDSPPGEWFFWATPQGAEVDLIRLEGTAARAIEIKSNRTFRPDHLKNLLKFAALAGLPPGSLELRYDGDESFVHQGVAIKPWRE
jgi:predicted AAA+ superfamily ATPase